MDTKKSTTATTSKEAKLLAKELGVKKMWGNDKGEYFSSENLALLSVGGDAGKLEPYDFGSESVDIGAEGDAGKKQYKITKADITKYPELITNGYTAGDLVDELDTAIKTAKAK